MEPNVGGALKSNSLLAWWRLLREAGYPDTDGLVSVLAIGIPRGGVGLPDTGILSPRKAVAATYKERDLMTAHVESRGNKAGMSDSARSKFAEEAEPDKWWLRGPYSEVEVSQLWGSPWEPACARDPAE